MSLSKETGMIFGMHRGKDYNSANPPLYNSSTFHQRVLSDEIQHDYTRNGNLSQTLFEEKLVHLEGGEYGLACASDTAAILAVLLTLNTGDHAVLSDDIYGGTFKLIEQILNRLDIEFTTIDAIHIDRITETIQSNTELIYVEAPSNLLFRTTGIHAVATLTKGRKILLAVDSIFMTPLGQSPSALGAGIVIHSVTKFLGRHSSSIAGAIITNNREVANALYLLQNSTGTTLSTYDS